MEVEKATYWVEFRTNEGFLGVTIIDVDPEDADYDADYLKVGESLWVCGGCSTMTGPGLDNEPLEGDECLGAPAAISDANATINIVREEITARVCKLSDYDGIEIKRIPGDDIPPEYKNRLLTAEEQEFLPTASTQTKGGATPQNE
jgi:hypothetical protein